MKLLKNRGFATVITICLILFSTLYSVHRTLGARCQAVTDGFYNGVLVDGYVHPSISSQLNAAANAAGGLVSVAANLDVLTAQTDALRQSRNVYLDTVKADGSFSDLYRANLSMQESFAALAQGLGTLELSDKDRSAVEDYVSTFNGAQSTIENAGYNESVREFNRTTLNVFPASVLGPLVGVKTPALFQ